MNPVNAKIVVTEDGSEQAYPWNYLFHTIKTKDTYTIQVFDSKENFLNLTNPVCIHYNCKGWKKV